MPLRTPFEPGQLVRHAGRPDWGPGQVQSVDGARVTVNFEGAGKVLIETSRAELTIIAAATTPS